MIHALEASAVMQHAPEPLPPPGNIIQHTRPQIHHNISCARYERGAVPLNPCAALVHLSLSPQLYEQYATAFLLCHNTEQYQFSM